jgi:hypothetical protein
VRFLGDEEEVPDGPPRVTRRKKEKALTALKTVFASSSEEMGRTPFVFWYAGERRALIADLPDQRRM